MIGEQRYAYMYDVFIKSRRPNVERTSTESSGRLGHRAHEAVGADIDAAKHGGPFRPLQPSRYSFMSLLPFALKTEQSNVTWFVYHDPKTALFFYVEMHGSDESANLRVSQLQVLNSNWPAKPRAATLLMLCRMRQAVSGKHFLYILDLERQSAVPRQIHRPTSTLEPLWLLYGSFCTSIEPGTRSR